MGINCGAFVPKPFLCTGLPVNNGIWGLGHGLYGVCLSVRIRGTDMMSEEKLAIKCVVRWALLICNRPSGGAGIMWRAEAHH